MDPLDIIRSLTQEDVANLEKFVVLKVYEILLILFLVLAEFVQHLFLEPERL